LEIFLELVNNTLYYIHDPMCSWCWAFKPTWHKVLKELPSHINVNYLLGGLAPDNDLPMPLETQKYVQNNWIKIQKVVPGTEFNYDFWTLNEPRRSTYLSCRAVISAKKQHSDFEVLMTEGIQNAYYLNALNPSNEDTLINIARDIGLNEESFKEDLKSSKTNNLLLDQIHTTKTMPISGFPSLVLVKENNLERVKIDYLNSNYIINQIIT
jgi:putative protein-disulfide isomerase